MTALSTLITQLFGLDIPSAPALSPVLTSLATSIDNGSVSFTDAISAAGSTQATGTPLTTTINTVSTVSAGQFVNLPTMVPGRDITVQNVSSTLLLVAPVQGSTDTINGLAATAGMPVPGNAVATFYCTNTGTINCYGTNPKKASLVANTASAAATLTAISVGGNDTFNVIDMTGSLSGGAALTLPTIAAVQAVLPFVDINSGFVMRVMNRSAGAFAWTVTNNGSFVTAGTSTVAQTTFRDFAVGFVNGTSAVATDMGGGSIV